MSLKIKPEHYDTLERAIRACMDARGGQDKLDEQYARLGLSKQRLRWDTLRVTLIEDTRGIAWICDTLYPYLNDDHIDSALRKIFGHKE